MCKQHHFGLAGWGISEPHLRSGAMKWLQESSAARPGRRRWVGDGGGWRCGQMLKFSLPCQWTSLRWLSPRRQVGPGVLHLLLHKGLCAGNTCPTQTLAFYLDLPFRVSLSPK